MTKKRIYFALSAVIAFGLAGCGTEQPTAESSQSSSNIELKTTETTTTEVATTTTESTTTTASTTTEATTTTTSTTTETTTTTILTTTEPVTTTVLTTTEPVTTAAPVATEPTVTEPPIPEIVPQNNNDWKSAYREVLNAYKNSSAYLDGSFGYNIGSSWDLQDLDCDGIPELLISEGEYHAASVIYYYFENGEAHPIIDDADGYQVHYGAYGTVFVCNEEHLLSCMNMGMGYSFTGIIKYENHKFINDIWSATEDSGAVGEENATYTVNGMNVTKAEYDTAISQYNSKNWVSAGQRYSFDDFSALN
ncbi:MAG: hypothetical protein IJM19_01080 [Ruminococcus sp.]|nr:hypothetical protein [Ruminococcus sp.]